MAELIRVERFGAEGVPREFTFSEIEEIGHQVGQMAASEVDRALVDDHRQHFVGEHPCLGCARLCMCRGTERDLATRDGPVPLAEAACYCPDVFSDAVIRRADLVPLAEAACYCPDCRRALYSLSGFH